MQINPSGVSLAEIASGQYDSYLITYAEAVRAYRHPVILSFGHEMNGHWYSWGYTHTSPTVFVAAWRHIVTVFREVGAQNVTWLWTVNIIDPGGIPSPAVWWPGNSYVNWVGLDGYYYQPSWTFASLFGPTIAAVRQMTPIRYSSPKQARLRTPPSQPRSLTCSPVSVFTDCSGSSGSTPEQTRIGASMARSHCRVSRGRSNLPGSAP